MRLSEESLRINVIRQRFIVHSRLISNLFQYRYGPDDATDGPAVLELLRTAR